MTLFLNKIVRRCIENLPARLSSLWGFATSGKSSLVLLADFVSWKRMGHIYMENSFGLLFLWFTGFPNVCAYPARHQSCLLFSLINMLGITFFSKEKYLCLYLPRFFISYTAFHFPVVSVDPKPLLFSRKFISIRTKKNCRAENGTSARVLCRTSEHFPGHAVSLARFSGDCIPIGF